MALENQAIQNVSSAIGEQYDTLINLMNDMSDTYIDARMGDTPLTEFGAGVLTNLDRNDDTPQEGDRLGYDLAGIKLHVADRVGGVNERVNGGLGLEATSPAMMLPISHGTANQQLFCGQLGDLVGQAKAMKNKVNQIAQR